MLVMKLCIEPLFQLTQIKRNPSVATGQRVGALGSQA